jgi:anti-sigma factor RsiW
MNCEEVDRFLDVYFDGELDPGQALELEQHLSHCQSCKSLAKERREFLAFFKACAPAYKAPPQLRAKLLTKLREEARKRTFTFLRSAWIYAAAALVLGSFLALNMLFRDSGKELAREAVLHHSRSLTGTHLLDVTSGQPQVVRSWLTAKLAFSPPVVGTPASGCSLIGARLDVIQSRLVAVLVYEHAKDVATLFCWPRKKDHLSSSDQLIEGYHVYTWSDAACNYVLVSKLSEREMDEFEDSFRGDVPSDSNS